MSFGDVLQDWNQVHTARVMAQTWGHLDAMPGTIHKVALTFTHGAFGDISIIDLDTGALPGGPAFHHDVHEHIGDLIIDGDLMRGGVWRWEGTYRVFKNCKHRFAGKLRPQRVTDRFSTRSGRRNRHAEA